MTRRSVPATIGMALVPPLVAVTCTHHLGTLPCANPEPHKGDGLGCVHIGTTCDDAHTHSEAVQS